MNKAWAQRWITLFDGHTDELMELCAVVLRQLGVMGEVKVEA